MAEARGDGTGEETWEGGIRHAFRRARLRSEGLAPDGAAPPPPRPSRYRLRCETASGAPSALLRGQDLEMDREVAVRVLDPGPVEDPHAIDRFLAEAPVAAQLEHPAILPVYGVGTLEDGRLFVAERLFQGETLEALRARGDAAGRLLGAIEQAARAVAYAHARGVAHGRLSLSQILVGARREVVVAGWDRAVRVNGDPGPLAEDVRALGAALEEMSGPEADLGELARRCAAGEPRHAGEVARAIGRHLADRETRARAAEVDAARERGDAEEARIREALERTRANLARRTRRRTMAIAASALLAAALGVAAIAWKLAEDRSAATRAESEVAAALREAGLHEAAGRWSEARAWAAAAAARARGLGAEVRSAAEAEVSRVDGQARREATEATLLARLEEIRLHAAGGVAGGSAGAAAELATRVDAEYEETFRAAGFDFTEEGAAEAARELAGWRGRVAVAAALHHWSWFRGTHPVAAGEPWRPILDAAEAIDPDPWRSRLRQALRTKPEESKEEWLRLGAEADLGRLPPATAIFLGSGLGHVDAPSGIRALREVLARAPLDTATVVAAVQLHFELLPPGGEADLLRCLASLVALRPEDACTWSMLAIALRRLHHPEEALAAALRSLRCAPDHAAHHVNAASILTDLGRPEEALRAYDAALHRDSGLAVAHEYRGHTLAALRRDDEALEAFRRALVLDPENRYIQQALHDLLCSLGRVEEALAFCDEILLRHPDRAEVHATRGSLLLRALHRPEEALAAYRRSREVDPRSIPGWTGTARCLLEAGRPEEALAVLREADRQLPERAEILDGIALVLHRSGRSTEARALLRRALSLDPDCATAQTTLGAVLLTLGDPDGAIEACRRAIELEPRNDSARVNLSSLLQERGAFAEAEAVCRQGIARSPAIESLRLHLGMALLGSGRTAEAADAFREARRLTPSDFNAWVNLGQALSALGRTEEALEVCGQAVERFPEEPGPHLSLGSVLLGLGRCEEAEPELRRAFERMSEGERQGVSGEEEQRHLHVACLLLARALRGLDRPAEAVPLFRRAVSLEPGDPRTVAELGLALVVAGEEAEGLRALHAVASRDGRYFPVMLEELFHEGKLAAALRLGQRMLEERPRDPHVLATVARRLAECPDEGLRDPARASALAERARSLAPGEAYAWLATGAALRRAGRDAEAVAVLEEAIRLSSRGMSPVAGFHLVVALHRTGREEEARRIFAEACVTMLGGNPPMVVPCPSSLRERQIWLEWQELLRLQREAEAALEGQGR